MHIFGKDRHLFVCLLLFLNFLFVFVLLRAWIFWFISKRRQNRNTDLNRTMKAVYLFSAQLCIVLAKLALMGDRQTYIFVAVVVVVVSLFFLFFYFIVFSCFCFYFCFCFCCCRCCCFVTNMNLLIRFQTPTLVSVPSFLTISQRGANIFFSSAFFASVWPSSLSFFPPSLCSFYYPVGKNKVKRKKKKERTGTQEEKSSPCLLTLIQPFQSSGMGSNLHWLNRRGLRERDRGRDRERNRESPCVLCAASSFPGFVQIIDFRIASHRQDSQRAAVRFPEKIALVAERFRASSSQNWILLWFCCSCCCLFVCGVCLIVLYCFCLFV